MPKKILIPKPKSDFIQVECPDCKKIQRIFSHATSEVHCLVCNCLLAKPAGGKAVIHGKIIKEKSDEEEEELAAEKKED
jgi:small subunit ribosomal protein S27e